MPKNAPPLRSGPPTPEFRDQVLPSPTDHEGHCLQDSISKKVVIGNQVFGHGVLEKHTEKEFIYELIGRVKKLSCARDEGRPLGIGLQEQVSKRPKLLR